MHIYVPDYYNSFKCIADKCKQNCCIGWEIDIDYDTYEFYKTFEGNIGSKLKNSISVENEVPHFVLDDKEKCPFLNENNLCDIITELGEKSLCQICTDHPRFKNYFSDRTEIGIGLCCEEACRIILTYEQKIKLVSLAKYESEFQTKEEVDFFALRDKIILILQNRAISIDERIYEMLKFMDVKLNMKTFDKWINIYLSFEQLDLKWTQKLKESLGQNMSLVSEKYEIALEQLLIYFILRHLSEGIYDNTLKKRVAFAAHATYMIKCLCKNFENIEYLIDTARQYSAEIEYSDENMAILLNIICD